LHALVAILRNICSNFDLCKLGGDVGSARVLALPGTFRPATLLFYQHPEPRISELVIGVPGDPSKNNGCGGPTRQRGAGGPAR
jgi:hypothetical protein